MISAKPLLKQARGHWFLLIELKLVIEMMKMVFSGTSSSAQISARSGAPEWAVRLMLLEACLWKALWRLLSRR